MRKSKEQTKPTIKQGKSVRNYRMHITLPLISKREDANKYIFADSKYCCVSPPSIHNEKKIIWKTTVEAVTLCKLFLLHHRDFDTIATAMNSKYGEGKITSKTVKAAWNSHTWVPLLMNIIKKEQSSNPLPTYGLDESEVARSSSHVRRDENLIIDLPHIEGVKFGKRRDETETADIIRAVQSKDKFIIFTGGIGCGKSTSVVKAMIYRFANQVPDEKTGIIRCEILLFRPTIAQLKGGPWSIIKQEFLPRATRPGYGVGITESTKPEMRISCMFRGWDGVVRPLDVTIKCWLIPDNITPEAFHGELKSACYNIGWICEPNESKAFQGPHGPEIADIIAQRARGSVGQKQIDGSTVVFADLNPTIVKETFWQMCLQSRQQESSFSKLYGKRRVLWCQFPPNNSKLSVNNDRFLPPIPLRHDFANTNEGEKEYEEKLKFALYARDMDSDFCEKLWETEMPNTPKGSQYWKNNVEGLPVDYSEHQLAVHPDVDVSILLDEKEKKFTYDPREHGIVKVNIDPSNSTGINFMTDIYEKTRDDYMLVVFHEITSIGNYLYQDGRKTNQVVTFDIMLELTKVGLYNIWMPIKKDSINPRFHKLINRPDQLDSDGTVSRNPVYGRYEITPDPVCTNKRDFLSYYRQMKDAGLTNVRKTPLRVKQRWAPLHLFLSNKRIVITHNCHFLKAALLEKEFKWDKKALRVGNEYKYEKNDYSHQAEALQYGCGVSKVQIEARIGKKIGNDVTPAKYFSFNLTDKAKRSKETRETDFAFGKYTKERAFIPSRQYDRKRKKRSTNPFAPSTLINDSVARAERSRRGRGSLI